VYRLIKPSSLPICCALKKGYTDVVYMLLKSGANVNKNDQCGKSAWIYFVELLASQWCKTAESPDVLNEESLLNMLKSMLLAGGDVNKPSTWLGGLNALHIASCFGMCDVMVELIQHGADCNYLTASGKSALDFAHEKGHEVAVELLLKNGARPDRKYTDGDRASYFSYAAMPLICTSAKKGSETMVKLLLKYGADVNASDKHGNTALHLTGSRAIIETVLNAGANVNAVNHNTQTALNVISRKLIARSWPSSNIADSSAAKFLLWGNTALHLTRSKAIIETLQNAGADINGVNDDAQTALSVISQKLSSNITDTSAAEILLSAGADANVMDKNGATPLYFACNGGMIEFVKLFLSHGASPNTRSTDKYPILAACEGQHYDSVKLLLEYNTDVTVRDIYGKTCLHCVLESQSHDSSHDDRRSDLVQLLLDKAADTNTASNGTPHVQE